MCIVHGEEPVGFGATGVAIVHPSALAVHCIRFAAKTGRLVNCGWSLTSQWGSTGHA
jgi:hypothetical protein